MKRTSHPKHPGIYSITHIDSQRRYIGSSRNIYNRWRGHLSDLRRNVHHSPYLQNVWNKYGDKAFRFEVLEICLADPVCLCAREQHWIDFYKKSLLNMSKTAEPGVSLRHTEEHKAKMRQRMLGTKHGEGTHYHGDLTEDQVREILFAFAAGETSKSIALRYEVTTATVCRIGNRKIWWRVEIPHEIAEACCVRVASRGSHLLGERSWQSKLTWEKVEQAKERHKAGEPYGSIARDFGVTFACIRSAIIGKTWNKKPA